MHVPDSMGFDPITSHDGDESAAPPLPAADEGWDQELDSLLDEALGLSPVLERAQSVADTRGAGRRGSPKQTTLEPNQPSPASSTCTLHSWELREQLPSSGHGRAGLLYSPTHTPDCPTPDTHSHTRHDAANDAAAPPPAALLPRPLVDRDAEVQEAAASAAPRRQELHSRCQPCASSSRAPVLQQIGSRAWPRAAQQQQQQQQQCRRRGVGGSPVEALPREVALRVLSFLSAEDLTAAAPTSSLLRRWTAEPVLWRRLFTSRWQGSERRAPPCWKAAYLDRDLQELREARSGAPEGVGDIFVQMQLAKRQQALGRGAACDLDAAPRGGEAGERGGGDSVEAWRRRRGFALSQPQRPVSLPRDGCWTQLGDAFCCDATGWVHLCDDTCREQVVDRKNGLLVCPISGRVSDRLLTAQEEEDEEGGVARDEDGAKVGEEDGAGCGGRLGDAFSAGYHCDDEAELRRTCGVWLSR